MKRILYISIISLLVMLFAVFVIPSSNGVQAEELTTTATTAAEEVTTTTAEEVPVTDFVIDIDSLNDAVKIALGELIDEFLGQYLAPIGITGGVAAAALLSLIGYLISISAKNRNLQLVGEGLVKKNSEDVNKLVDAVIDKVAPELGHLVLESTRSNALSAVIANGLDILIMASNNEQVAQASKEFHRMYSEALSIKSADANVVQNVTNSITSILKKEASKVVENTVQTLTKVKNDKLAKLRASVQPEPESGV